MNLPGRFTGLNRQHPAVQNCTLAALATAGASGRFYDHYSQSLSDPPVPAANQVPVVLPFIGHAYNHLGATANRTQFSDRKATAVTVQTYGMILQLTSLAAQSSFYADGANGCIFPFATITTGALAIGRSTQTTIASAINLAIGVPYFVGISYNGVPASGSRIADFVVKRLDTGYTQTDHITNGTQGVTSSTATVTIGSGVSSSAPVQGYMSMMVHSTVYLPLSVLLDWANDPWGVFDAWPANDYAVKAPAGASFNPAWAYGATKGVGAAFV